MVVIVVPETAVKVIVVLETASRIIVAGGLIRIHDPIPVILLITPA